LCPLQHHQHPLLLCIYGGTHGCCASMPSAEILLCCARHGWHGKPANAPNAACAVTRRLRISLAPTCAARMVVSSPIRRRERTSVPAQDAAVYAAYRAAFTLRAGSCVLGGVPGRHLLTDCSFFFFFFFFFSAAIASARHLEPACYIRACVAWGMSPIPSSAACLTLPSPYFISRYACGMPLLRMCNNLLLKTSCRRSLGVAFREGGRREDFKTAIACRILAREDQLQLRTRGGCSYLPCTAGRTATGVLRWKDAPHAPFTTLCRCLPAGSCSLLMTVAVSHRGLLRS
jgi:hypothetical protein